MQKTAIGKTILPKLSLEQFKEQVFYLRFPYQQFHGAHQ